jgi:DNA polymerase-3 subunit chi
MTMTRIDFHFNTPDKLGYTCRLVRKAYRAGKRMLVYSDQPEQLAELDRALWSFSAHDFIPHVMAGDPLAPETPVVLSSSDPVEADHDLMINLGSSLPPGYARFDRLIELVSTDEQDRAHGRNRLVFYRARGYPIETHDIAALEAGR